MKSKEELISFAKSIGASSAGIAKAQIYTELLPLLEKRGFVPYVKKDLNMRINPFLHLKNAKSVIVCTFPYLPYTKDELYAKFARGEDYHPYVKGKLKEICVFLGEEHKYRRFVDSGGLCDKYLAYKAGLGFFGKNNLLYNKTDGSRFYIGLILTDIEYEADTPLTQSCLNCNKCIKACPGGALGNGFYLDYKKCASYISQTKEELTEEQKAILKKSGYVWGCDICADVCPLN